MNLDIDVIRDEMARLYDRTGVIGRSTEMMWPNEEFVPLVYDDVAQNGKADRP